MWHQPDLVLSNLSGHAKVTPISWLARDGVVQRTVDSAVGKCLGVSKRENKDEIPPLPFFCSQVAHWPDPFPSTDRQISTTGRSGGCRKHNYLILLLLEYLSSPKSAQICRAFHQCYFINCVQTQRLGMKSVQEQDKNQTNDISTAIC